MAIPLSAPMSTSAQDTEERIDATVVGLDASGGTVLGNSTIAPSMMVGASFTGLTVNTKDA